MICKICGTEGDGAFCKVCGAKLGELCPYCGADVTNCDHCPACGAPTGGRKRCKNCGAEYRGEICLACGVPESAFLTQEEKQERLSAEGREHARQRSFIKNAVYFAALLFFAICSPFAGVETADGYYFAVIAVIDLFRSPLNPAYIVTVFFSLAGILAIAATVTFAVRGGYLLFRARKRGETAEIGKYFYLSFFVAFILFRFYNTYFEYLYYGATDSFLVSGPFALAIAAMIVSLVMNCKQKNFSPLRSRGTYYGIVIGAYVVMLFLTDKICSMGMWSVIDSLIDNNPEVILVALVAAGLMLALLFSLCAAYLSSYYSRLKKKTVVVLASVFFALAVFAETAFGLIYYQTTHYVGGGLAFFSLALLVLAIVYAAICRRSAGEK